MSIEEICIVVKTYPTPSKKYWETVCCGGITRAGEWRRLHPVPFRRLEDYQKFRKYEWIRVDVERHASDPRPESYRPRVDTMSVLSDWLPAGDWRERMELIYGAGVHSLEELSALRDQHGISMGTCKVRCLDDMVYEPVSEAERREWEAKISQQQLPFDDSQTARHITALPYKFRYVFRCENDECPGHRIVTMDFEVGALFWRCRDATGNDAEAAARVRERCLQVVAGKGKSLHFFVGTHHRFGSWLVGGVAWPPATTITEVTSRLPL